MSESPKDQLEIEMKQLISKYCELMRDSRVAEVVIGEMTCFMCDKLARDDQLTRMEENLYDIITKNSEISRKRVRQNKMTEVRYLRPREKVKTVI
jgi:hypothetical protein